MMNQPDYALALSVTLLHRAIARYEADIAAGRIAFGSSNGADRYPGKTAADRALAEFIAAHVAWFER